MGLIDLKMYPRSTTGKNANRRTRSAGRVPAVIYGNERTESANVELDTKEFSDLMKEFGGQYPLFNLTMDGSEDSCVAVLREMQKHPVSDVIFHCDLFEIPLGKPLKMEVALNITGRSQLVRSGDAVLDVIMRSIEVECLPKHLPDNVEITYEELEIGDTITISDLDIENVTILNDPDDIILKLNLNVIEEEPEEEIEGEEGEAAEGDGEGSDGGKPEDSGDSADKNNS
jgi:large subunit ribosomal protein L25